MGDKKQNLKHQQLPPGFRFEPTDEELVVHFLQRKATLLPFHPDLIPDLHLYPYDPWDLNGKALGEGKQWYFYSRRTENQNRVTSNGYWKPLGIEEPVFTTTTHKKVGIKRYYVFYVGEAPSANSFDSGLKTNWIMHEYRLSASSPSASSSSSSATTSRSPSSSSSQFSQEYYNGYDVVCRVYERNEDKDDDDGTTELSCLDQVFLSLDDLDEISNFQIRY